MKIDLLQHLRVAIPAQAGIQTCPSENRELLRTGFLLSQETIDSCLRRNDRMW